MLSVNTLQPPKTGRSRFSKALPAVPGMDMHHNDDNDNSNNMSPTSPTKDLPVLPPAPPPPPRSDSIRGPRVSNSPLPALSLLKTANSPPSAPPKMAIPRRPVGLGLPAGPRPGQQKAQPLAPPEPSSPSESLSSILSAYSRSSGESLVRDSDVPISARESEATISPSDEATLRNQRTEALGISYATPTVKANEQTYKPYTPAAAAKPKIDDSLPPPPPSKDDKYNTSASPAPPAPAQNDSEAPNPQSPPQPQIWRRRSLKAERTLELPDLNLATSHGSTASTQQTIQPTSMQSHPGAVKVTPLTFQPPRTTGGLPGRDIRPTPPQEQVAEDQAMGSSSSKLKNLKDKLSFHRRGKSSSDTTVETTVRRVAHRPPTPEYHKEDIKTPIVDTFVSPVSPASSPELSAEASPVISSEPARVASTGDADAKAKPISRKAVPATTSDLNIIQPPPESIVKQSQPATEPFPSLNPAIISNRSSSGSDSPASHTPQSTEVTKFPPRKSSARSNISRIPDQFRQPAVGPDSRLIQIESQGPMYRGRDGTLYPEMKVLQEPDPQAFYFPKQISEPIPEDSIMRSVPLKGSHYNCYHGHKTMNRRTNRNYPLTCQTCEKSDAEDRWACTFCHLRICESCYHTFNAHQRDLQWLVNDIRQQA